jgi:hypothetical protein
MINKNNRKYLPNSKSKFDFRPLEIIPRPDGINNDEADKIFYEWWGLYDKFQKDVESLIKKAGGNDKLKVKLLGKNPLRHIAIQFR